MAEHPFPDDPVTEKTGLVTLRRLIVDRHSLVVTAGDFGDLFIAWSQHAALWGSPCDELSAIMVRQGLAAAVLHLANRTRDETVAWTINIHQPPTNLFLTGEARTSIVTGRIFTDGVRTVGVSRIFVQTVRPGREPVESVAEIAALDILEIFEQYYRQSEQNPARFFSLEGTQYAMILGMPGVDASWIASADERECLKLIESGRLLEERSFRFECGCNPQKMLKALRSIFQKDPEELFQGDPRIEVSCPRCGRRWWVSRDQFLAR